MITILSPLRKKPKLSHEYLCSTSHYDTMTTRRYSHLVQKGHGVEA